jgi:hypothetical protein
MHSASSKSRAVSGSIVQKPAIAQVDPIREIRGTDLLWRRAGLRARLLGELDRDHGARQDLLDLGARILGIAEHLEQLAGDLAARGIRVARDLDDDRVAILAALRILDRHATVVGGDPRIVGLEVHAARDPPQDAGQARAPRGRAPR